MRHYAGFIESGRLLEPHRRAAGVLGIFILTSSGSAFAQSVQPLPDAPSCSSCRITLRLIATLGADEGPGFVGFTSMVVTDGSRYFVTHHGASDEIQVFDADGTHIRTLGRAGDGPGEFRSIQGLQVGPGDSLFVFDGDAARLTVFAADLQLARTARVLVATIENGAFVSPDGRIVLNGHAPAAADRSAVVHLIDSDGHIIQSLQDVDLLGEGRGTLLPWRWFAPPESGGLWIAHYDRYLLEHRAANGKLVSAMHGTPSWFREGESRPGAYTHGSAVAPKAHILDIVCDDNGLIWIVGETPSPEWQEAVDENGRVTHMARYIQSIIEVVNPVHQRVIARRRIRGIIRGFVRPGLLFAYREATDGTPRIDLLEVRVER